MIVSLLTALLIFISLREAGRRLSAFLRWSDAAFGLDLCMGIGFVHLLFLIISLFCSPEMVQMFMLVFHLLMNGSMLARFNLRISRPLLSFGTIIFILMLAPLDPALSAHVVIALAIDQARTKPLAFCRGVAAPGIHLTGVDQK